MRACTTIAMAVALMGSSAVALPHIARQVDAGGSFTNFVPAGEGDVRSPCPALNALANHGFLPHDGTGITLAILTKAIDDGFNVQADFAALTGGAALHFNTGPPHEAFTLAELDLHGTIEHDGSLSRSDYGDPGADNHSFNQTAFQQILDAIPEGQSTASIYTAASGRRARILSEYNNDPDFKFPLKAAILSYAESALYLAVLDSVDAASPPVDWVKILFEQERIPYAEGWRRTTTPINVSNLLGLAALIRQASDLPSQIEEDVIVSAATFQSILNS